MPLNAVRKYSVCIVIAVLAFCAMKGQSSRLNEETGQKETLQYYYGVYGALSMNLHTAGFGALPGFPSCCADYNNTTQLGPAFGLSFELPLANSLRLQTRLGYSTMSGILSSVEQIGNEPILTDGVNPILERRAVNVEHTLDAGLPLIVFEPTIGYQIFNRFWATAGARVGYMVSNSFSQKETLLEPVGYVFLDGSAIRNTASGAIPGANTIQMHATVGIGYELNTRSSISLVPEVRYFIPITQIAGVAWNVQSFQLGINIRYGVYHPIDPTIQWDSVYRRDTVIAQRIGLLQPNLSLQDRSEETTSERKGDIEFRTTTFTEKYLLEIPRPFDPGLSSTVLARDANGRMAPLDLMRIEELDVIESYPLLPQVFFPDSSSDLASTNQMRLETSDVRDFRITELTRDQNDVYRNLLNVVGQRMKANPRATLTLHGHVSNQGVEQNNRELSRQRAEAVKAYFTDVWGLESERFNIKAQLLPNQPANPATPDGRRENQRVEIETNDPSLLEPVEFRDRDLIITPKDIILHPQLKDQAGVRGWSVRVRQGDRDLYSNKGDGVPSDIAVDVLRMDAKPKKEQPLISTFEVRDVNGIQASASDTVEVDYITLQTMKARQEEGKMIERYSLIVFDFNSAQLNPSNQRLMQRVKERIQPESRVTITGFADRQGNPDYNRELARKRCLEAQRVLGLSSERVTIDPVGSDRLLFDNDTPVGRSYSRTVQIEIVTPLR